MLRSPHRPRQVSVVQVDLFSTLVSSLLRIVETTVEDGRVPAPEARGAWRIDLRALQVLCAYCEDHQCLQRSVSVYTSYPEEAEVYLPGPPNTRISSLVLPPLSLIGIT